jgi:hypothetical protein
MCINNAWDKHFSTNEAHRGEERDVYKGSVHDDW